MKITLWYTMVIIDVLLLISSFFYHNLYLTMLSFIIALQLNKFKNIIPIPKQFENLTIIDSAKKNKKSE